ncbi:hypothetical protein PEPS_42730 (plasmid) [Persicobacter psychrovividus]|uniref:Uncharacterized protein n=1 Tax=Persicobacter psychrovividus TaxID=387638 RepID=A0ABM7VLW2_9BACT|nr:hypothetical protein PEPS_42730 [Persicobacter psychrovividus]
MSFAKSPFRADVPKVHFVIASGFNPKYPYRPQAQPAPDVSLSDFLG